ncbi:MAG TPA: type IVB secretion system protein IcmH/DotU, partial [Caulobacteraceae bacterium]|nr:type IVB secretion system protein IcmH/DotU [Caulobacteraceae bacterium]
SPSPQPPQAAAPQPAPGRPAFPVRDDIPRPPIPPAHRNPLMAKAAPLLALLASIRSGRAQIRLPDLHRRAAAEISNFQAEFQGKIADEHLRRAVYALAATADDVALNLPLPSAEVGEWAQRSLVARSFQEAIGGDRFWRLLDEMIARPAEFQDLLEFYHACMAAGFEGRYRVTADGRQQHQALMQRVYQALEIARSLSQSELAPHWRGENAPPGKVGLWAPLAIAGAVAVGLLLVIYIGLRLWLEATGGPARAALASINPPARLTLTRDSTPVPVVDASANRVRTFLAPEIAQGLVTVPDVTTGVRVITTAKVVAFEPGSDQIAPAWKGLFDRIAQAIDKEPGAVRVEGYTDSTKPHGLAFPDNLSLSKARADTVAGLIRQSLSDKARTVTSQGFGESDPIGSNATPAGRAQNRRVEIALDRGSQ